jgi:hypothetical protein
VYFWKIGALKQDLSAPLISDRYALPYLLWWGGTEALVYAIPEISEPNLYDHVNSAVSGVLFVIGTLYAFRCNGGSGGNHFLTRYICLGWVLGVRFLVIVLGSLLFAGAIVLAVSGAELPESTTSYEASVWSLVEIAYYVRLSHHIREVGRRHGAA